MFRRRPRSLFGYTIIEVLVVLAVSGVMLTAAIVLVGGLQPQTQFSQAAYDLQSRIDTEVRGVGSSLFPRVDQYSCSASSGSPTLTAVAPGSHTEGTSQDCIFLGKVLRVEIGNGKLFIYSVLGCRTTPCSTGIPASSFNQTTPTVAHQLDEIYDHDNPVLQVISAKDADDNTDITLTGFYNNLSNASTSTSYSSQASASVLSKAYSYSGDVQVCIGESGCSPKILTKWTICLADYGKQKTALLSVTNSGSGVITSLKFQGC